MRPSDGPLIGSASASANRHRPSDPNTSLPLIFPENNNDKNMGVELPNFPFLDGAMELMAVPKKKVLLPSIFLVTIAAAAGSHPPTSSSPNAKQAYIVYSRPRTKCATNTKFCDLENSYQWRREMALDVDGGRLLMTSSSIRAPVYQVRCQMTGMAILFHSGSITTVDWHPTLPIFLTGSADHSVRVTTIS
ncbi:hypothetical protein OROMI_027551 [Orobanche minor]